jgi:hypothetical protein
VRTWDQDSKNLGSTGCNGRHCTTRDDNRKYVLHKTGTQEHASTGLRRLRPEEAYSTPGCWRNGRKRSGADRCARSGPRGASASDPTLRGSSGVGVSKPALIAQGHGASASRSMVPRGVARGSGLPGRKVVMSAAAGGRIGHQLRHFAFGHRLRHPG